MEDGMESILFTLLGRYLTLFNRPSLALAYFTAAATADPDHLPAQYGVARCLAQQGHILEASTVALQSLARLPEHPTIRPKLTHDPEVALEFDREDELDLEDMQVLSLVCLVAELAPRVPPPAADTVLPLLGRLGRFFASSASFAVEAVARHWLPLACVTVADICQNAFVQRALRESETFGAMALEGTVCTTRHELLLQVLARRSHASDSSVQPNLPGCDPALDLPAACVVAGLAAIAEHCHFVQYCVPVKPDEHNLLGTLSVLIEGKLQAFDANDGSNRDSDSHRLAEPNPNHSTTTAATCSNEDSVICLTELVVALAMYENLGAALGDKVVGLLTHARLQHLGLGDAVAVLQSQVMDVQEEQKLSMALVECSAADVSRPEEGLRRLAALVKPGGVLYIATYSRIGHSSWLQPVQLFLQQELPALYSPTGQLLRQPTTRELQALRMRILELPSGHPVRAHLTQCQEFYTSGGCRDLLFHPCQTLFTLKDWQRMLRDAGLTCVGVFFPNLQVDVENRAAFRARFPSPQDPHMCSLELWHKFEEENPDAFGRMHVLYCQKA